MCKSMKITKSELRSFLASFISVSNDFLQYFVLERYFFSCSYFCFRIMADKSTGVEKAIDPIIDLGNLLFIDRDPIQGDAK